MTSCAQRWQRVGAGPLCSAGGLHVQGPDGWVRWLRDDDALAFTRDGAQVQWLLIRTEEAALAFPATERSADAGLLPAELAECAIGELRTRAGLVELEVLENDPVTVAGRDGFRVRYRQMHASGLRTDHLLYGCVVGDRFVRISFAAPTLHYFDRDRPDVERAAATFRLDP